MKSRPKEKPQDPKVEDAERIDLDVHADDDVIVREEDVLGILGKDA